MTKKSFNYDQDFYGWTNLQAKHLKNGDYSKIDIKNLILEIESRGNYEKNKLENYIQLLLIYLLKIKYQPTHHSKSWDLSVKNARYHIKRTLEQNPSLKTKLPIIFKDAYFSARLLAAQETGLEEKVFPIKCNFLIEEILT